MELTLTPPPSETVADLEWKSARVIAEFEKQGELARCEAVIERGLTTFYEVGTALLKIRDARLYRASHATFEEYCRERWQFKKSQAYRLIEAAEVVGNLSPMGDKPTSERQVRPLAGLAPEHQQAAWERAVEESYGEQPTAAKVEEVAKTITQVINERRKAFEPAEPAGGGPTRPGAVVTRRA